MRAFLLSFFLGLFNFCSPNKNNQPPNGGQLPKKMPDDFTVEVYDGGGMLPISSRIYISKDSSYSSYHYYEAENKTYFSPLLSGKEIDERSNFPKKS